MGKAEGHTISPNNNNFKIRFSNYKNNNFNWDYHNKAEMDQGEGGDKTNNSKKNHTYSLHN